MKLLEKIKNLKKETKDIILLGLIGFGIVLFSILFDQITKYAALGCLKTAGTSYEFIPGFLDFTLVFNTGAAWGTGGDATWSRILLIIISWAVALFIIGLFIFYVVKKKPIKKGLFIIVAFILGGDIGNLIDRTFFYDRGVIDFLSIQSWWPGFGIFNIADSILVCSIFALIIYYIVEMVKEHIKENKRLSSENEDVKKVEPTTNSEENNDVD